MSVFRFFFIVALIITCGGCGLHVPEMQEPYESQVDGRPVDEKLFENVIVNNVKCELHKGVDQALHQFGNDPKIQFLREWGATVNFKLTVDEKGNLNPGATFMPTSVFSVGVGATTSADATRIENISWTYAFKDLLAEGPITDACDHENGAFIQSDLKIADFIVNKSFIATVPGSVSKIGDKASPFSVFSEQITFVIAYGVSATPTWKFTKVTVDPTSPLYSMNRTKTQDLTITLGPAKPATKTKPAQISSKAEQVHFAALIGQAVATAIQSQQRR